MKLVVEGTSARALRAAALASAATVAFDMAGRATRDALFLSQFGARALPVMVVGGSAVALCAGLIASRWMAVAAPVPLLRRILIASGLALLGELALSRVAEREIAVVLYLHVTALSGLFISGFWTALSERFDPRTVRQAVGRIAAAGTAGGVGAGVVAASVASSGSVGAMLALMAVLNFVVAASLGPLQTTSRAPVTADDRSSVRAVLASPYVRALIGLVILGAVAETLLDFVFMTRANAIFHDAASLLRVFAALYTTAAVLTVIVQLTLVRRLIDRVGLSPVAASLPAGVLASSLAAMAWPGLLSAAIARGTELVLRNSTFRSAYELLFNALPTREKRAAKTLVDVTALRSGRILGSGVIQATLWASPGSVVPILLGGAAVVSATTLVLFPRIVRGHRRALGEHLSSRVDLDDTINLSPESLITGSFAIETGEREDAGDHGEITNLAGAVAAGDFVEVRRQLAAGSLATSDVALAIDLLGWDPVVHQAFMALDGTGPEATPRMVAAIRSVKTTLPVRRRLVRLLASRPSVESRDALMHCLGDERFELRYRCGLALTRLIAAQPALAPSQDAILAVIAREIDVDRRVWDSRGLIHMLPDEEPTELLGEALRERTDRSLEHVFRLLALVLPDEPLRAAFHALQSDDAHLRGAALDYVESVVPTDIRRKLWQTIASEPTRPIVRSSALDEVSLLYDEFESIQRRVEDLTRRRVEKKTDSA